MTHPLLWAPSLPSFRTVRKRPHFYPGGGTFALTFRLAGSVTRPTIRKVQSLHRRYGNDIPARLYWSANAEEREAFRLYAAGQTTRRELNGPFHLHHNAAVRDLIIEAILHRDRREWIVLAFSLMPNHVHLVVKHISRTLHMGTVLQRFKSFTATMANRGLGTTGAQFWEHEGYDTIVETAAELRIHCRYTLLNPVYATLAIKWHEWPGNYCNAEAIRALIADSAPVVLGQQG